MTDARGRSRDLPLEAALERVGLAVDDFESVGRCAYRAPALGLFVRTDVPGRERLATHEVRFARWAGERSLPTVKTGALPRPTGINSLRVTDALGPREPCGPSRA